jgi:hypothetical protein
MNLVETGLPAGEAIQRLWHAKRRGTRLPTRADFSIDDLRPWLGRLILVDVLLPGPDLYYRVHGTTLAELLGQELTGRRLSDLQPPDLRELIRAEYAQVIEAKVPMLFRRERPCRDGRMRIVERILLPLSHAGETVDQVLSLADFIPFSPRT